MWADELASSRPYAVAAELVGPVHCHGEPCEAVHMHMQLLVPDTETRALVQRG